MFRVLEGNPKRNYYGAYGYTEIVSVMRCVHSASTTVMSICLMYALRGIIIASTASY